MVGLRGINPSHLWKYLDDLAHRMHGDRPPHNAKEVVGGHSNVEKLLDVGKDDYPKGFGKTQEKEKPIVKYFMGNPSPAGQEEDPHGEGRHPQDNYLFPRKKHLVG